MGAVLVGSRISNTDLMNRHSSDIRKHSTPGISPMHLSKHNYGRLQFFVALMGIEPTL